MKIVVTGANGFLGRGIVEYLLNHGNDVIAVDVKDTGIDKRAKVVETDIFNCEEPYELFCKPDVLLHLAWRNGFIHNSDTHFEDLYKHDLFIKKMIKCGVRKVCIMGSMHEIGFFEGAINENTPCNPMSMYGIAKNALRQSIEMYAKQEKVDFMWLRGYYIVSDELNGASIFSKIAKAAKNGETTFPFTTGLNQYDYLDYEEFCEQVGMAIMQSEVLGIINICSGRPEKLGDCVERFIKEKGLNIKPAYGTFPDRPYDSKAVWGDDSKIRLIMNKKELCDNC